MNDSVINKIYNKQSAIGSPERSKWKPSWCYLLCPMWQHARIFT